MKPVPVATVTRVAEKKLPNVFFGQHVTRLMKARDINQTELAKRVGIERSYLSRILNGTRRANTEQISQLAKALGVPEHELFPRPNEGPLQSGFGGKEVARIIQDNPSVSDPGSTLPPGLKGFLERHHAHISDTEREQLLNVGPLLGNDPGLDSTGDAFWWAVLRDILRRYFKPPEHG